MSKKYFVLQIIDVHSHYTSLKKKGIPKICVSTVSHVYLL